MNVAYISSVFSVCFISLTKSETPCNFSYLQISKSDIILYNLHMWNISKNLVREYWTLTQTLNKLIISYLVCLEQAPVECKTLL